MPVANHVTSAPGHSQKKEVSPGRADCQYKSQTLKFVKGVSCVTQLFCAQPVTCAQNVVSDLPVGARLQSFWETWLCLGAGPKVVQILREGYTLPFRFRPYLTRSPSVVSCYVNPLYNSYLLEALHQFMAKNAVESVQNQTSLGFFNRLFLVPKPNNSWRPILDLSKLNLFLKTEKFKMETPETIRTSLQQGEWVTSVDFRDAYFHIPYTGTFQEISQISCPGSDIPVQSSAFWSVHSPYGVHCDSKGGETDGHSQGYKNPPVPRRLVGKSYIPPNLSKTHPDPGQNVPGFGRVGELGKVRTGTQTSLQLRRLPVRPQVRSGQTDTGPLAKSSRENTRAVNTSDLSGPAIYVPDRSINSHRKAGSPRPIAYETHTVASQKQLEGAGIAREDHSSTKITPPTFTMVATGKQCATRSTITPHKACSANLYRRIKRRLGRSLQRAHCKRVLVGSGEQVTHKLPGTQSSFSSIKRVPEPLCRPDDSDSVGQHHSGGLHKQGRRHAVGAPVCSTLEDLDLVFPEASNSEGPTHPRPPQCDSGQTIQAGSDHTNRMVPPSRNLSEAMQQVAPTSDRLVCHEVQSQVTPVCVFNTGPLGGSSGCTHPAMGRSGCIRLPTDRHTGQSGGEATELPVQEIHSHCPGMAQHALVLGLGEHVKPGPSQPTQPAQPADSALQSDPSQKSDKSKSPCLAPRATKIKEQGFSEAVAARIEAPQRRSTRSVYEAKWTIFTKWCDTNQVDFRSPPVKSVADFLMHLFEDKKLQPSTIDGYRSAIADKLGSTTINISKDDNLTRLLESFHRDRPKGRRGIPS